MKELPKNLKYNRCFRLKLKNKIKKSYLNLINLNYGLKALESGWITNNQLKTIIRLIKILIKKNIKIKINSSLIIPITKKPLEMRMGKGKAERKYFWSPINKGMIIIEIGNISFFEIYNVLKIISRYLPVSVKIVKMIY